VHVFHQGVDGMSQCTKEERRGSNSMRPYAGTNEQVELPAACVESNAVSLTCAHDIHAGTGCFDA
jgi:hypothetical protein